MVHRRFVSGVPYRALVFDFDGTLADSFDSIYATLDDALRAEGVRIAAPSTVRRHIGLPLEQIVFNILPRRRRTMALAERVADGYRAAYPRHARARLRLFAGIPDVLDALAARGVALAVASNKNRRGLDLSLVQLGLDGRFAAVVGSDEVARRKPDPESLLRVLDRLGVPPAAALMVGDADVDVEMAHRTGCDACAVTWGMHSRSRLRACRPRFLVDRVPALLDVAGLAPGVDGGAGA